MEGIWEDSGSKIGLSFCGGPMEVQSQFKVPLGSLGLSRKAMLEALELVQVGLERIPAKCGQWNPDFRHENSHVLLNCYTVLH